MRITSRTKAIAFFITLGACLVALTVVVNVSWIVLNWRQVVPLVLGVIFFGLIIAGLVVNTVFLVREIRRNEQQDSFLNAVTHELKTPSLSIRLYLGLSKAGNSTKPNAANSIASCLKTPIGCLAQSSKCSRQARYGKEVCGRTWREVDSRWSCTTCLS